MRSRIRSRDTVAVDLTRLNQRLLECLVRTASGAALPIGPPSRLVFPKIDEGIRVSEQEPRFLFCHLLERSPYRYSVETPTEFKYSFSKGAAGSRKAMSDLSLYEAAGEAGVPLVNIEFKAHNPDPAAIRKDVEKLIAERPLGHWCHILHRADAETFRSLFGKFLRAFREVSAGTSSGTSTGLSQRLRKSAGRIDVDILFAVHVIDRGEVYLNRFLHEFVRGKAEGFTDYARRFFEFRDGATSHTRRTGGNYWERKHADSPHGLPNGRSQRTS
jgi:hypothetical protein